MDVWLRETKYTARWVEAHLRTAVCPGRLRGALHRCDTVPAREHGALLGSLSLPSWPRLGSASWDGGADRVQSE